MQNRLDSIAQGFGDVVLEVLRSQRVEDLEMFLAFLVSLEAAIDNAREAGDDRLRKLKIAKKWNSPN